ADRDAQPPLDAFVPLCVLSMNVGLLDRWYPFAVVRVPQVDTRRERAPLELLADGWDVLLLQEVWERRDVDLFVEQARARGYLHYAGSDEEHEAHGLLILVREALVDPAGPDERRETTYELQREIEEFPGPGFRRGFLSWRFRHAPTGVVIDLFDDHTTAFPELSAIRDAQARELGLAIREVPDDELVIAAGDFNAAPYYPHDEFGEVDGQRQRGWWRNTQSYALVLHYGELVDTFAAAGQARDVELLDDLPPFGPEYAREPIGDRSRCEALVRALTATDCNSLYFEQYAATEYPARLDFVFYRDASGLARVLDSAIEYTEPLGSESFELSDHYGVGTTLLVSDR
ncbi:MAG: endonuclease/exonuclease/phosphatase family protein, partial [Myxococcales bacterium]|nr:endonuclease/exonuclease/phosphatase family protein [Myxococcales bacterium]